MTKQLDKRYSRPDFGFETRMMVQGAGQNRPR
jgi:hypothetical protein